MVLTFKLTDWHRKNYELLNTYLTEWNLKDLDPELWEFIEWVIDEHLFNNYDAVSVITGREGVGKSSCAWILCFMLSFLLGKPLDLNKSVAYSLPQFNQMLLDQNYHLAPLWLDEGTRAFYKRASQNTLQVESVRLLTQSRFKSLFYAICSPRFSDLDEYLRGWRMRIWIEVVDRGHARVFVVPDEETEGDPWHLDDIKLRHKRPPKGNLVWEFDFPPMPALVEEEYLKIKLLNFQETTTIEEIMSAKERAGCYIAKWLVSTFDTWDKWDSYKEQNREKMRKPFSYESLSKATEIVGIKVSDSTIRDMVESVTPLNVPKNIDNTQDIK